MQTAAVDRVRSVILLSHPEYLFFLLRLRHINATKFMEVFMEESQKQTIYAVISSHPSFLLIFRTANILYTFDGNCQLFKILANANDQLQTLLLRKLSIYP